jgi:hypothetical protein
MSEQRSPEGMRRETEMYSIKKLADEALALSPKFDRLPLAIYRALDNHSIQGSERTRLFGEIQKEFKMRKHSKAKARGARPNLRPGIEQDASSKMLPPLPPGITAEMMRDAIAHELSQPPSAWDLNHPENSP